MIEIHGANVIVNGERIGMLQGTVVFLAEELSGREERLVREKIKEERGIDIEFSSFGNFVS